MVTHQARNNLIDFQIATNNKYEPNWHHEAIAKELEHIEKYGDRDFKILILTVPPRHGKLMADSTPVFTTDGWKQHGSLRVGDYVYGRYGDPVMVKWISPKEKADYLVHISDGSQFITHANHEWVVFDRQQHKEKTIETKEMKDSLSVEGVKGERGHRYRYQLDANTTLSFPETDVAIHPYFLGVWLGDGRSSAGDFCGDKKDVSIVNKIENLGYKTTARWTHKTTGVQYYGYSGLKRKLRNLGVLNNKHIPDVYKYGSLEQRLELLAGLVDTDGHKDKRSRYRFSTCNKVLAEDVRELVTSLGSRAYIMEYEPVVSSSGIRGRQMVYQVGFNLCHDLPTALERKRRINSSIVRKRSVVSIEKLDIGVSGNCIEVEGGVYLVGKTMVPTHNSQQASIDFPAWFLGRNPQKEIITASYSADLAIDFGTKTREKVESEAFQLIFPDVTLRKDERSKGKWRTLQGGSYTSVGIGGPITGRGADILDIDDPIKNREEAESQVYREKAWDWFTSTAFTRLEPNGVVVLILTRWHQDDLAGRILAHEELSKRTKLVTFPAVAIDKELQRDIGDPLWDTRFTREALEEIKTTVGPYDWSALYQGQPILTENQEFNPGWYKYREESLLENFATRRFLTVDTAISKAAQADYTGFCDNRVDRENYWNLAAWRQRLGPEELVEMLFTLQHNNHYEKIGIEKTAYLDGLKPYLDEEQRKRGMFLPITELKHNQTAKEIRIRGLVPRYSSGSIFHIQGRCKDLEEEQMHFPMGMHDDVIDACFVAGTKVLTDKGQRNIETIVPGDLVMTRDGYKEVEHAWLSGEKEVIEKIGLTGTKNHPVITTDGVKDLQYVLPSDTLYIWNEKLSCIEERNITDTQNQTGGNIVFIIGCMIKQMLHQLLCIGKCGSMRMVKYRMDFMSTIKTVIASTTQSKIWNLSLAQNTPKYTQGAHNNANGNLSGPLLGENMHKNGTPLKKVENGTESTQRRLHMVKKRNSFVLSVVAAIKQQLNVLQDTVLDGVKIDTIRESLEKRTLSTTKKKVYNLEVKDTHEYFANNVLVHNCAYQLQIVDTQRSGPKVVRPKHTVMRSRL